MSIKDMVGNNKQVFFVKHEADNLWYETECGFKFPVPIVDTNEAAFINQDKAMFFMKWIKRHMDAVKTNKQVSFVRYQTGEFWYKTDSGFEFPVPIADSHLVSIVSNADENLFVTWIKKHEDMLESAKKEQKVA